MGRGGGQVPSSAGAGLIVGSPGRCWLPAPSLAWGLCGGGGFGRSGVASVVPMSLSVDAGVDGVDGRGSGAGLHISLEMRSLGLVNRSLGFPRPCSESFFWGATFSFAHHGKGTCPSRVLVTGLRGMLVRC